MYENYYAFSRKPFHITPNPEFLFLSRNHKEVFAHLLYGIQNQTGFIEITGEVGTGKTTVLRTLLNQLDNEDYRLALIFNPALSALELLQVINREFGVESSSASRSELQAALNRFLLNENRQGRTVVLVIDEAQNLQAEVLEEIRLLSNLETETDKLVQIILVGQPELAVTLARPELRQLSQRITVRYQLKPMSETDTSEYIRHRLRIAGHADPQLFAPRALKAIYHYSGGVPRLINLVCDRALLIGYTRECRHIEASLVRQAIRELARDRPLQASGRWLSRLLLASLLVTIIAAGYIYLLPSTGTDVVEPGATAASQFGSQPADSSGDSSPQVSWDDLTGVRRILAQHSRQETLQQAGQAIVGRWVGQDFDLPVLTDTEQLRLVAQSHGLEMLVYTGDFSDLLNINLPALLELYLPGHAEPRYLAIESRSNGMALITPALPAERRRIPLALLRGLWTGRALVFWNNPARIGFVGSPGRADQDVVALQELLRQTGYYSDPPSGSYDQSTLESVTRFQADRGLIQDGRVGPLTLIHLYQASGRFDQPLLQPPPEPGGPS